MNKTRAATVLLVSLLAAQQAWATGKPSDEHIRRELIGSWIVPYNSADWTPQLSQAIETYGTDGSDILNFYSDIGCTKLQRRIVARWSVANGILTTTLPNGVKVHDEVVAIGHGKLTLHSLDDDRTYTEIKALTCAKEAI